MQRSTQFLLAKIVLCATLQFYPPLFAQKQTLDIVYPKEGSTIVAKDSTFVYGHYSGDSLEITVNGHQARLFANQTFLAFIPVRSGHLTLTAVATPASDSTQTDSTITNRRIYIPFYLETSPPDSFIIDTSYVFPATDLELLPGAVLGVAVKGSQNAVASFAAEGLVEEVPMIERHFSRRFSWGRNVFGRNRPPNTPDVRGIYVGTYVIPDGVQLERARIEVRLQARNGQSIATEVGGSLSVLPRDSARWVRVRKTISRGRKIGRRHGDLLVLPAGAKLPVLGRDDGDYRVQAGVNIKTWLPVELGDEIEPPESQQPAQMKTVFARDHRDHVRITLPSSQRLPFRVRQLSRPNRIDVTIYGIEDWASWVKSPTGVPAIRKMRGSQISVDAFRIRIDVRQERMWGFRAFYDQDSLIVAIRKPAGNVGQSLPNPLAGMLICVDPGHGPDPGALGATGLLERDANFALAVALREVLREKGAYVIMTRNREHGITLNARRQLADVSNADLFLSLHHNALPDGANPFRKLGASVFYFHPQSESLANNVLKKLLQRLNIPKFGLFHNNLAVCRLTSMPAILVESAFLTHPKEEALILDPEFRRNAATAIAEGIESFISESDE